MDLKFESHIRIISNPFAPIDYGLGFLLQGEEEKRGMDKYIGV
jgi:hypothetical protein